MSGTGWRRTGARRGFGVVCAAVLLVTLPASATVRAADVQPSRASGHLIWLGIYEETGDDWNETWSQGEEAIITVRMVRQGSEWVDAGSSFRGRYLARYAPHCSDPFCLTDCTIVVDELFWLHGARFDDVDAATGFLPSRITLTLDEAAGTARLQPVLSGGQMAGTIGEEGSDCQGEDGTTVFPWSPNFSLGAYPTCPIAVGAAEGRIDAAGTRIDFNCLGSESGETPNGEALFRHQVRVDGSLTLTP